MVISHSSSNSSLLAILAFLILSDSSFTLRSSTPRLTFSTVTLNPNIVRPKTSRIRGSHPSGKRSSLRNTAMSSSRPPNAVRRLEALFFLYLEGKRGMWVSWTHFELPKTLCCLACVYWLFRLLESNLRRVSAADMSRAVTVLFGPVADERNSSIRSSAIFDWSGWKMVSCPSSEIAQ